MEKKKPQRTRGFFFREVRHTRTGNSSVHCTGASKSRQVVHPKIRNLFCYCFVNAFAHPFPCAALLPALLTRL